MDELQALLDAFKLDYTQAPLYGGYSRILKRKVPAKSQVRSEFIENIQMLSILTDDQAVKERIASILKSFE